MQTRTELRSELKLGVDEIVLFMFQLDALQIAVDEASERRNSLAHEEREALVSSKKTDVELKTAGAELAVMIADKDAEIQAFALLLLHYCTGLQKAREMLVDGEDEEDDGDDEDDEGMITIQ